MFIACRLSTVIVPGLFGVGLFAFSAVDASARQAPPASSTPAPPQGRRDVPMDPARARQLYVSNRFEDHSPADYARDVAAKAATDKRYTEASNGVMDFKKVTYRSSVGDLDIPAYLFQPLNKRAAKGHAALVWVHGGVHGNWGISMFPFVRDAVERGFVVICPEYRGSTGPPSSATPGTGSGHSSTGISGHTRTARAPVNSADCNRVS